jgi:hypothetical protein
MTTKPPKSAGWMIKLEPEERAAWHAAAHRSQQPLSTFVREAVEARIALEEKARAEAEAQESGLERALAELGISLG